MNKVFIRKENIPIANQDEEDDEIEDVGEDSRGFSTAIQKRRVF